MEKFSPHKQSLGCMLLESSTTAMALASTEPYTLIHPAPSSFAALCIP